MNEASMTEKRILYACTECADNFYESCGWFDKTNLRVMDDGRWLCDGCFDQDFFSFRRDEGDDRTWSDFPEPPEYGPLEK